MNGTELSGVRNGPPSYTVHSSPPNDQSVQQGDAEFDKLVDEQSVQPDPEKRKKIVWQLERMLAEEAIRPVIFYPVGATCRQPWVKGLTIMVNSIYNGWRFEDVWLDK